MDDNYPSPGPRTLLAVAVALEGGLGALAVAVGWIVGCPTLESIRLTWPAAVAGIAAGLPMLLLLWACVRVPLRPLRDLLRVMDQIIVPLFRGSAVWHLAVIAALAGWGEELLFRGLIQQGAARWIGGPAGPWVALAAASLLFGLAHPITKSYVVLAAMMGLYLGGLWMASENLLVPMLAHGVYDFLALVYLVKMRS